MMKNAVGLLIGCLITTPVIAAELETFYMDTWLPSGSSTPVIGTTQTTLQNGGQYFITVQGTYTIWTSLSDSCGQPEANAIYPSPSTDVRSNTQVGFNAAWKFAAPTGNSRCNTIPGTNVALSYSLDNGTNWNALTPPLNPVPNANHEYVYQLKGQGDPLQLRFEDSPYTDNYGQLKITLSKPDAIDNAMYFRSQVKDGPDCTPEVTNGKIFFPPSIKNPAAACPDAFAWTKFLKTIQTEFWKKWAYDSFTWPQHPYILCTIDNSSTCCQPGNQQNPGYTNDDNPGINCPYYPGDNAGSLDVIVKGKPSFKQHVYQHQATVSTPYIDTLDPGRVIRQEMAEVVFRNKPMWSYIFENNLYNKDGLGDVFTNTSAAIKANAPYRPENGQIEFPTDSIMFKTDWLFEAEAKELNLCQNEDTPCIAMTIKSDVGDNDQSVFKPGLHYLVAVTAASKDLPNWHWYAMEHVDNLGRCDYTGCNDSFGYETADTLPGGYNKNFTKPLTESDNLGQPSPIFKTGKIYPSGTITPALQTIYTGLGIGQSGKTSDSTSDSTNIIPSISDPAWLNYRLKGTQTEFVTNHGINAIVGNSITEGGFVNSSSCMTCHVQATINANGERAISSVGFSNDLNLFGYNRSQNGVPQPSWFYAPGSNTPIAVQTDYVWGILSASDIVVPTPSVSDQVKE
jgi:hypothetical protein